MQLVRTPVGARCHGCVQVRRLPTFEYGTATHVRAVGMGVVLAGVTGVLWGLVFFDLSRMPFLPWTAVIGIGYVTGEGVRFLSIASEEGICNTLPGQVLC